MKTILQIALLTLLLAGCNPAKEPQSNNRTGFINHTYKDPQGELSKFTVFVPTNYDAQIPCPTILFLHGAGQVGRDGKAQVQRGLGEAIRHRTATFPFLTVFPQAERGSWSVDSPDGRRAMAILESVRALYNVDRQRTYLTGYSMGGEGTWSLAAAFPNQFAAIIPICPSANLNVAGKLKQIPCWCFQGDADAPNTMADTRKMMLAIKAAGGRPIYQEYPGVEHNCWDITYANDEIYEWLLLHKTSDAQ